MKLILALIVTALPLHAGIVAGVGRVDITDRNVPVNDPCFAKALVLKNGGTTAVLITIDAVAIGEIGRIGNSFLSGVRADLKRELGIAPEAVLINASHCHGVVRGDLQSLVVQTVKEAAGVMVPVTARTGTASETRISENRRMFLKDGTQADMRRAYSMPSDEEVESIGPIDPQVGLLRLDREDGTALAVLYHFACHPITNAPAKGSSADFPGAASKVIEDATGAMAFFVQGCCGDINPANYKVVNRPADADPLGAMLGATVLAGLHRMPSDDDATLRVRRDVVKLPRAADYQKRMDTIDERLGKLTSSLKPTNIDFKGFVPLLVQHGLWPDRPSHHAQGYLRDPEPLQQLDATNMAAVEDYLGNIRIMEEMTRLNTNRRLLERHLEQTEAAGGTALEAEVCGLRVGAFKLVTVPGELTVQIGLDLKREFGDPNAHVSGYTNGYLYYTATEDQRLNTGYAQEDCDVLVAPEWRKVFDAKALEVLRGL